MENCIVGRVDRTLTVGVESDAVHGVVDDPGRVQAIMAQRGDESLRAPVAERGMISIADLFNIRELTRGYPRLRFCRDPFFYQT